MKVVDVLIWAVVAVLLLMAVCAGVIWLERKFPGKEYDERQKIARGNAYRFSFWTGMLYYFGLTMMAIWNREWKDPVVDLYLALLFGLMLQALAFHVYCVITHAALPMSENPKVTIVGYFILCAINLTRFLDDFTQEIPMTGEESSKWIQMLSAVFFLILALTHLLQYMRREKE